jgi:hypothetical protein
LVFDERTNSGVGDELKALYTDTGDMKIADRLAAVEVLLRSGALSTDVIQKGVIDGVTEAGGQSRPESGLMAILSHLLGGPSDRESIRLHDSSHRSS